MAKKEIATTPESYPDYVDPNVRSEPTPAPAEADTKASRLAKLRAALSASLPGDLWNTLSDLERRYACHWLEISEATLSKYGLPEYQWVLDYLRRPAEWQDGASRGYLVSEKTLSIPIVADSIIDIRTIDKGTRLSAGVDFTDVERAKWLSAGLVKELPCITIRALVDSTIGPSVPNLKRGKLLVVPGGRQERILEQWLEMGWAEFICDGAYKGELAALPPCPMPFKSVRKSRVIEQVIGTAGVSPRRVEWYFDQTSQFADTPATLGGEFARGFTAETRPLVRCRANVTDTVRGVSLLCGSVFEVSLLYALKVIADPALRVDARRLRALADGHEPGYTGSKGIGRAGVRLASVKDGDAPLEILEEIPDAYRGYAKVLREYLADRPGTPSDAPGFPQWSATEYAA